MPKMHEKIQENGEEMKLRIYVRVAKIGKTGTRVSANKEPNFTPFSTHKYGKETVHPTVLMALDLEIPDEEFSATRLLLKRKVDRVNPALKVSNPEFPKEGKRK